MRVRRYQIVSADPLTGEARTLFGTYSLTAAQRVWAAYYRRPDCNRVLEYPPIDVEIPRHHAYACRVQFTGTARFLTRDIVAVDAYAVVGQLIKRFGAGIDWIGVWLFKDEMEANEPPFVLGDRRGGVWKVRRAAS